MKNQYKTVEDDNGDEMDIAWDDVSGATLDPKAVRRARMKEFEYIPNKEVWVNMSQQEALRLRGMLASTLP